MDTITILFFYRGSQQPHRVTIPHDNLPTVKTMLDSGAPFSLKDVTGKESRIYPGAVWRVAYLSQESEG